MRLTFLPLLLAAALAPAARAGSLLWTLDGKTHEGETRLAPPDSVAIATTNGQTFTVPFDNILLATFNPPKIPTLAPPTGSPKTYPPNTQSRGILLKNGAFLAGAEVHSTDDKTAAAYHLFGRTDIPLAQISRIICHPLTPALLARINDRVGVLTNSGDFSEGELSSISDRQVKISSVIFGIAPFNIGPMPDSVATINLRKLEPEDARFHLTLVSGSLLLATAATPLGKDNLQIDERTLGRIKIYEPHLFALTASAPAATALTSLKPRDSSNLKDFSASTSITPFDLANGPCVPADSSSALLLPAGATLTYDLAGKVAFFNCRMAVPAKVSAKSRVRFDFIVDGKEAFPPRFLTSKDAPVLVALRLPAAKTLLIKTESTDPAALAALGDPLLVATPPKK